jgi:hypothetical protein
MFGTPTGKVMFRFCQGAVQKGFLNTCVDFSGLQWTSVDFSGLVWPSLRDGKKGACYNRPQQATASSSSHQGESAGDACLLNTSTLKHGNACLLTKDTS